MHKLFAAIIIISNILICQQTSVERIDIESKQNGIAVNFHASSAINTSEITGWHNHSTSWSYITIYNSKGDEKDLNETNINGEVSAIEIIQLNESLQVGIRTIKPIDQFEFYNNTKDSTMVALLRYPIEEILAYNSKKGGAPDQKNNKKDEISTNLKTVLYFLSALVLVNIIST